MTLYHPELSRPEPALSYFTAGFGAHGNIQYYELKLRDCFKLILLIYLNVQ